MTPADIQRVTVDRVEEYKYLGVYLDNKVDWSKKSKSRRASVVSEKTQCPTQHLPEVVTDIVWVYGG